MTNNSTERLYRPLLFRLLVLTLLVFGCMLLMQGIATYLVTVTDLLQTEEIAYILNNPTLGTEVDGAWTGIMLLQAFTALGGFVLAPLIYVRFIEKNVENPLVAQIRTSAFLVMLVVLIVLCVVPFISYTAYLNAQMQLPATLSEVENYIQQKEENLKALTIFLTDFPSVTQFLIALVVIAVIPAVGEELLFRGLLQNFLIQHFGRRYHHGAVWLVAIIFSAIHVQFYGFIPRLLLGALFGYLYLWTQNLWYPIVAHFINNGATLLALYLYQQGTTSINLEEPSQVSWWGAVLSLLLTGVLVFLFEKRAYLTRE
ncbi:MAG: CPBP family intramembrane glutamic endopeptidase [Bacteroidota bacterium]